MFIKLTQTYLVGKDEETEVKNGEPVWIEEKLITSISKTVHFGTRVASGCDSFYVTEPVGEILDMMRNNRGL